MLDLQNNVTVRRAISPVSVADNTAQIGQVIDTAGFHSLEFLIATGSIADVDATFAVTVDHGNQPNLSDASAVPATELLGTLAGAGFIFSDDDKTRKIGYLGGKRYVRLTITPSANASAALIAAVAVLGHPGVAPVA